MSKDFANYTLRDARDAELIRRISEEDGSALHELADIRARALLGLCGSTPVVARFVPGKGCQRYWLDIDRPIVDQGATAKRNMK